MEEERKNKKNRRKKSKQAIKPTESTTSESDASKSTLEGQRHILEVEQNSNSEVSGVVDTPSDARGCRNFGSNNIPVQSQSYLAESEKQYCPCRETNFQDKQKELEAERDALIQKESSLEERITQLLEEKAEIAQKEACEREKNNHLQKEKNESIQNEAVLRERIKQLQKEMDENAQKQAMERENIKQLYDEKNASIQNEKILLLQRKVEVYQHKEASLEAKILQLEGEKDSLIQKEIAFEDKINQLVDEAGFLNLTEVSLRENLKHVEKERDSWILKENSAMESVARLTDENTTLLAQVTDLEHSKECLLDDKLRLTQTVSNLQLQISNLESAAAIHQSYVDNKSKSIQTSEDGDVNCQLEAARALLEKLVVENSELIEKMNELYAELDQKGIKTGQFKFSSDATRGAAANQRANRSDSAPDLTILVNGGHSANQATDLLSEASKTMPVSELLEDVIVEDQIKSESMKIYDGRGLGSSSEIVQLPLDETESKESDKGLRQDDDVGLIDSPMIGAPFRLISFVARFVSGADLVHKNSVKSG